MYTIGSLADLISGKETPGKKAVKIKKIKYEKPRKGDKQGSDINEYMHKEQQNVDAEKSMEYKYNKGNNEKIPKSKRKAINSGDEIAHKKPKFPINTRPTSEIISKNRNNSTGIERNIPKYDQSNSAKGPTADAILNNKQLRNAEKRKLLKNKKAGFKNSLQKKPKLQIDIDENKDSQSNLTEGPTADAILKNRQLRNAEKRKLLKNTKAGFKNTPQKKPKLQFDIDENKDDKSNSAEGPTADAILKNRQLRNAEKRKLLKNTKTGSNIIPQKKQSKKPKVQIKVDENKDNRTIFVGNIPLHTTEKEFKKFFSVYGDVESVRFRGIPPPDMKTPKKVALLKKSFHPKRKSMIGYVVFKNEESATKAQIANGKSFKDFHLRVDSLKIVENDKKKSIFLGNLPLDVEEETVRRLFEDCGRINNIRLIRDSRNNVGKGFGFVNFENADAVELALEMENVRIGKREVRISRGINPEESNKKRTLDGKKIRERYSIHINNLPKSTKETDIRALFSNCGKVIKVRISKGAQKELFCYVNFKTPDDVQRAVNMTDPQIKGTSIKINECKSKTQSVTNKMEEKLPSIYIKKIPLKTTKEEIHELFKDCGNISLVRLFVKKTRPTGVGFVNFDSEEAVKLALKKKVSIHGSELLISRKVSKAEVKEKKNSQEEEPDSEPEEEILKDLNDEKNWEDEENTSESEDSEESDNDEDEEMALDDQENYEEEKME